MTRFVSPLLCPSLALVVAGGCVGRASSRFAGLSPTQARAVAQHETAIRDGQLRADLRSAHPPANVLVLSGGDAHGAFGCGVLAGWRSAAVPRPTFDVVTGVSTGALMATFAFLGQPQDDATLRDVYLHARDADIFRGPVSGPPDAVFDTAPLRHLIASHVTADTLRRVAAAHRDGRRLYVATVELDTGALFIWPMSRLAADAVVEGRVDADRLERFRAILLAAASIPVLFPPVEIDGGLHVDAGLRQAVFLHPAMLGNAPATPTVWVVFNGPLGPTPQAVDANVADIGGRSLSVYTQAVEWLSVQSIGHLVASHRPACRFRWVSEPPADAATGGLTMFDPAVTSRLYATGAALGTNGRGWHDGPPTEVADQPR